MSYRYYLVVLIVLFSLRGHAQIADTLVEDRYVPENVKIANFKEVPDNFLGKLLYRLTPEKMKYNIEEGSVFKQETDTIFVPIDSSKLKTFQHPKSNQELLYRDLTVKEFGFSEETWAEKNKIVFIDPVETEDSLSKIVYGFHPFWMGTAYESYPFSLLSRVAYFSFDIQSSKEKLMIPAGWDDTKIISAAHDKNCKVDVSISSMGKKNTSSFLNNKTLQNSVMETALSEIQEKGADGVNLNFEDVSANDMYNYFSFIKIFSQKLKQLNKEYLFSICLPAIDWSGIYLVEEINQSVDLFIVMGYDFNGNNSILAGPNAPLHGNNDMNISNSLYTWYSKGLSRDKTLLAVPYFGYRWQTHDALANSSVLNFEGSVQYRDIVFNYKEKYKYFYDSILSSSYIIYNENNRWSQIWYDGSNGLADKYKYIKAENLAGLGIWALGYDNGLPNLWNLIQTNFTVEPGKELAEIQSSKTKLHGIFEEELTPHPVILKSLPKIKHAPLSEVESRELNSLIKLISILVLVLSFFAVIGFVIALFDYNVREVLFSVNFRVIVFFTLIFILIQIVLRIFDVLDDKDVLFIIGIGLGIAVTFIVVRTINSNMKNPRDLTP